MVCTQGAPHVAAHSGDRQAVVPSGHQMLRTRAWMTLHVCKNNGRGGVVCLQKQRQRGVACLQKQRKRGVYSLVGFVALLGRAPLKQTEGRRGMHAVTGKCSAAAACDADCGRGKCPCRFAAVLLMPQPRVWKTVTVDCQGLKCSLYSKAQFI